MEKFSTALVPMLLWILRYGMSASTPNVFVFVFSQFPHNKEQTASPESQVLPHKSKSSPSDELLLLSFDPFLFFFTSVLSDVFHHSTTLKTPYVPQGCLAALSVPNPKEAWLPLAFPIFWKLSSFPGFWLLPPCSSSAITGHVSFPYYISMTFILPSQSPSGHIQQRFSTLRNLCVSGLS